MFKAMKSLDKVNESAPAKLLARRRVALKRVSQLGQIQELRDEDMYDESEPSMESPDVAPRSPEPAKGPLATDTVDGSELSEASKTEEE